MEAKYLKAILLLLVQDHERNDRSGRVELLLSASGLGYQEIAELVGKKPDAVRMLIKRSKET